MDNQAILHKCRPGTATLSKPQILDPSWSMNIDMTEIRLATLAEVESLITKPRKGPVHITEDTFLKYKKRFFDVNDMKRPKRNIPGPINNERPKVSAMDILGEEVTNQVPTPCRACAKNDKPERFHSHPKGGPRSKTLPRERNQAIRNAVSKPVALKYKSGKAREPLKAQEQPGAKIVPSPRHKPAQTLATQLIVPPAVTIEEPAAKQGRPSPKKSVKTSIKVLDGKVAGKLGGQKTQVDVPILSAYEEGQHFCKRCGKTFGTDEEKFRAHLEGCMNEWDGIPASLEDDHSFSSGGLTQELVTEEDKYHMYITLLKPCPICNRKFFPNRLETHEAACRKINRHSRI
ncbi:uncharacterized protein LOC106664705 [Cimex lectularius]|uniref:C2HC/C3H-type domain-containing protein n=1 Tax=Cimex lectularius TaxID=79782 RepID=A0A8I6TFC5_CIMLE|nr:uncharacterized protein LOC106664705 [Cimex lectularius]